MKKTQKRAFILSECKSPYIAQAIFILKDGVSEYDTGVLADAERIVASYMGDNNRTKDKKDAGLCIGISAGVTVLLSGIALLLAYLI